MAWFSVNRRFWLRGGSKNSKDGDSVLLNKHGRMCCLGQIISPCVANKDHMLDIGTPAAFANKYPLAEFYRQFLAVRRKTAEVVFVNSDIAHAAMNVNDSVIINDSVREALLMTLFEDNGHHLTFHS